MGLDKQEARDYIKMAIANNVIMHPNHVRQLYQWAELPTPPHLRIEVLTDEQRAARIEMGDRLVQSFFSGVR